MARRIPRSKPVTEAETGQWRHVTSRPCRRCGAYRPSAAQEQYPGESGARGLCPTCLTDES